MALQNGVIFLLLQDPFTLYKPPTLPPSKHPETITLPPPCLTDGVKHSSSIFSFFHLTNVPQTQTSICLSIILFSNLPLSSVCSFAHLNLFFLLASLRYGFFFATFPRRPESRNCRFTVDIKTGVLWVLFNNRVQY